MDDALFPLTLEGHGVRLEPLSPEHVPGLIAAASESRDTYGLTGVPHGEAATRAYVARALDQAARGLAVPFATVSLRAKRIVGSTRFLNLERWSWPGAPAEPVPAGPDAVEIGATWLAASAQRTHVNTAAKLLMLAQAFEVWRVRRVSLKTDARNQRSRANIERIGGQLDGIARAHSPAYDGGVRDSALYAILPSEWPAIRARLEGRLTRGGTASP